MMTPATNRAYGPPFPPATDRDAVVRELDTSGNGVRFHIVGHLSEHAARLLRQRVVDDLLDGARLIVLDLAHAQSFESGALGLLVSISRLVSDAKGEAVFENASDYTRLLFERMGLDHVLVLRGPRRKTPTPPRRTPMGSPVIPFNGPPRSS